MLVFDVLVFYLTLRKALILNGRGGVNLLTVLLRDGDYIATLLNGALHLLFPQVLFISGKHISPDKQSKSHSEKNTPVSWSWQILPTS